MSLPDWDTLVLVGVVARPHGIRGDVVLNPETDFAETRFAVGASVWTKRADGVVPLRVARASFGGRRPVVGFDGIDADGAELLSGAELRVDEVALVALPPGSFYQHQLVGCRVESAAGERIGDVVRIEGGVAATLLVVAGDAGEVLVPFVETMCPTIDVAGRVIRVDLPDGLLEVNVPTTARRRRPRRPRPERVGAPADADVPVVSGGGSGDES